MIIIYFLYAIESGDFVCFFFSSRRRHTRWTGDWSSDVCSSDLIWNDRSQISLRSSGLRHTSRRVGKIARRIVAAWALRAFTPVFDGLLARTRFCPRGRIEQRAFAHPTASAPFIPAKARTVAG